MPKIINVQGLGPISFPDSMNDADISSAIETDILPNNSGARAQIEARKQNPPAAATGDPNAKPQSFLEQAMPPLAHPIEAVKGFGSAVAGGITGLAHPVDTFNADMQTRGAAFQRIADRGVSGLTDPETTRDAFEYAVPFFGPAMAGAGRQMNSTDPQQRAQGFGAAVANTSGPEIVRKGVPPIAKAVADAGGAARTALTETIPSKMSNATIGATRKFFKFGANPGEAVRGLVYNSVDELPAKLESEVLQPYGKKLESVLNTDAAKTKMIDLDANIEHAFAKKIGKAERDNNQSLANTLQERMKGRIDSAHELSGGARYTTPDVAYKVMKQLGDDTKWTADPVEGTVEDAKQTAYQNINAAIDKAIPAAVPLTRKLANALTAQKAVQVAIDTGQSAHPFIGALNTMRRIGAVGGAIGGIVSGHPEAGLAGAAVAMAPDVLTATPVSSRISAGLSRLGRREPPLPQTVPSQQPKGVGNLSPQDYAEVLRQMGIDVPMQ